jgi:integrase
MIIKLFRRPNVIARLTQSPAAPYLDAVVSALREQGYAAETIKHYVLCTERFCQWLDEHRLAFTDVSEPLVNRYTTGLPRRIRPAHPNGIPHKHAGGLFHLVTVLRQAHVIPPLQPPTPVTEGERWLARYGDHLDQRQGAAWSTRGKSLHYVRRLIEFRFPGADPDWSALDASDIVNFLAGQACHGKGAMKTAASAVRSLLRFLVLEGAVRPGLEAAVPPLPRWRLSGLPRHLTTEQVDHVLRTCRQSSKSSSRNIAVLLLLARLGLRADEVAGLQFDDVDWREGVLRIRSHKSRRERQLPLSTEVGLALAEYLRESRPTSSSRSIFLHGHAPFRPLRNTGVGGIARRALKLAGVVIPRPGAHVFRHTAATRMICRGATLPQVAEVLGHVDLETTASYAKLDLATLSAVAMPWPGGGQ